MERGRQPRNLPLDLDFDSLVRGLSAEAAWRLAAFVELLTKWNRRVNLVSSTEKGILRPLLGEAVWAAGMYPTGPGSHLDIGSGAGFPALPLAILRPDVSLILLEPRSKRAAFLETAAHELDLSNTIVVPERLDRHLHALTVTGPWRCVSWKGIKLQKRDLLHLVRKSEEGTQLWAFRGTDLPLDEQQAKKLLILRWSKPCPFHAGWFLSEYVKRPVSRETA